MTCLLALLVVGAWIAVFWVGLQAGMPKDGGASTGLLTFRFFDPAGWVCLAGAGVWLLLWFLLCPKGEPFFPGTRAWHFGVRQRHRIFEGRLIEPGLLRAYGALGVAGFALGLAVVLKLAAAIGWQDPAVTAGATAAMQGILPLAVLFLSGRLVRDVLLLRDFDYFVGDQACEYAEAVLADEEQGSEAQREQERKTIRDWAFVVLVGGFFGTSLLAGRLFSAADGNTAVQASLSGLILSSAGLYLLKTRPRRWRFWLVLVSLAAIGFMVFTQISWGSPLRYQLLGALWGLGVGTTGTVLYLRQLNSKPR